MEDSRIKIEQLKWLYAGLAGISIGFYLTVFSSVEILNNSFSLLAATVLFAIPLPLFTSFTIAHIIIIESKIPPEQYEPVLKSKRIRIITQVGIYCFYAAFLLMVSYISILATLVMLIVTLFSYSELRRFFKNVYAQK